MFKKTEAEEVVFVLPKGSKLAKQEQYFTAIKQESDSSGKKISVMSADPVIIRFASQHDINLLEMTPKRRAVVAMQEKPEVGEDEDVAPETEEEQNEHVARLAAARTTPSSRFMIKDIIRPEATERPVKIKEEKDRFEISIKKDITSNHETSIGDDITQVWAARENRQKFTKPPSITKNKSAIFGKKRLILIGGAALVLIFILYSTLGRAQIVIKPQTQPFDVKLKTMASTLISDIDLDFNRIPGQRFEYKDQEIGEFPATGQKNVVQKASGKITIYNKSYTDQRLVATTRFKTPSGLIFRIPETINLPAATKIGTTVQEGSAVSLVYADKAGEEYNIGPTTFTIPGFEGSPKYEQFYAKSDKAISGGIVGAAKVVTEEDFTKAQESLTAKLNERIIQSLKNQASELKIIDATQVKFEQPVTNVKTGDAAETLRMTIEGAGGTVAFRESDVFKIIENYVAQKGSLEILEKDLTIEYLNPKDSPDGSSYSFDVHVTGRVFSKIDQEKIVKDILGADQDTVRTYFQNMKEVESARVIFSPFWVKTVPKELKKVTIELDRN